MDRLLGFRDRIVRPGAISGADEADDGIALLQMLGQHAFDVIRGRIEAGLDDRFDTPRAENLGDILRETFEPGSGAGDEDAWRAGHACECDDFCVFKKEFFPEPCGVTR